MKNNSLAMLQLGEDGSNLMVMSQMDKKHMALVAIAFIVLCYTNVLNSVKIVDSAVCVDFLKEMIEQFDSYQYRLVSVAISPTNILLLKL